MDGVSFQPAGKCRRGNVFQRSRLCCRKFTSDVKLTFQVVHRLIWQYQFRDVLYTVLWAVLFTGVIINDLLQYLVTRNVKNTSQVVTVPLMFAQTILVYYAMGCYHVRHFCRKYYIVPHMRTFLSFLFYYIVLLLVARLVIEIVFNDTRPEYYPSLDVNTDVELDHYAGLGN